jgi:hypothetical protein
MSQENEPANPDAIDHWNWAIDAEDAEDYQTALQEYDDCLCSTPDAETAVDAFFRLGLVIHEEYDLDDENLDDEQRSWRCCELACYERSIALYETHREEFGEDQTNLKEVYLEAQTFLQSERPTASSEIPGQNFS